MVLKNSLPCLAPHLKVCNRGGGILQLNQVWFTVMLIGIYLEILLNCNFYTKLCFRVSHSDYMVHTHTHTLAGVLPNGIKCSWIFLWKINQNVSIVKLFFNSLANWVAYITQMTTSLLVEVIIIRKSCLMQVYETSPKKPRNCNIKLQNSTFTRIIKEKNSFWGKKALKNTFPQQKNTTMKKSTKKKPFVF